MLQLAKDYHCSYVLTFKPGHMPAVWEDFQGLLKQCPENTLERIYPRRRLPGLSLGPRLVLSG